MSEDDRKYLEARLHSPAMQCRQCELTRQLLEETATR